ncbi:hypothetical protein EG328_000033 [Venturia inaequalis]|uniref:Protein Asterix n=1 Tax=Venturia inaequalis TaxID=5025 RepID=A0A8H3ZB81_VENIN|nr:hypothetical protein EG327_004045 [Venturia inaequalis]KAE9989102.1 hypothetical protein EG328_000033 [Venturia inaequalis]RDI90008.1 hypothetical protein Vi05172_g62 [Venturia inaequalis]
MASKKDMRRADLTIPYVEPPADKEQTDMAGTMASTMPMVAIVTRSKMLGWTALVFAIQSWLAETPAKKAKSPTPGYFTVLMGFMSLAVSYMPLFLPPMPGQQGTGTGPAAAAPPS